MEAYKKILEAGSMTIKALTAFGLPKIRRHDSIRILQKAVDETFAQRSGKKQCLLYMVTEKLWKNLAVIKDWDYTMDGFLLSEFISNLHSSHLEWTLDEGMAGDMEEDRVQQEEAPPDSIQMVVLDD